MLGPLTGRPPGVDAPTGDPVYRLRDLSPGGKLVAGLLAVLLALPAVIAFFQFLPIWRPTGDTAFITQRAWDVGTSRTPAMGQPSTSALYGSDDINVRHLGPWHAYLMAPSVRLLGSVTGVLVVSVLVSSAMALTSAWAVFRRLGSVGGVLASATLAAVLFGMGAAALLNPISSNFSITPLLCAAVLTWAVLSGDIRLLPLATVTVSFSMQQHLSTGPTMLVLGTAALVGMGVVTWRAGQPGGDAPHPPGRTPDNGHGRSSTRRERTRLIVVAAVALGLALQAFRVGAAGDATVAVAQVVLVALGAVALVAGLVTWWRARLPGAEVGRDSRRFILLSAGTAAVLWLPLILQELFAGHGNLSALITYAGEGGGDTLGLDHAFRQLAHVVGFPPLLTDTQLDGHALLLEPSLTASLTAVAVLGILAARGYRWLRSGDRRAGLVLMTGVLVLAGLVNGGNVPKGMEQGRLAFYHWIWPLSFFVLLSLAYVLADAAQALAQVLSRRRTLPWTGRTAGLRLRHTGLAVVVVAMAGLAAVNPSLDRPTNTLSRMSASHERELYESLADQVMEHEDLLEGRSPLLLVRGEPLYEGSRQALGLALADAGRPVLYPRRFWTYAHDDLIAWERDDIDSVLMYVIRRPSTVDQTYEGTLLATYELQDGFDGDAYVTLLDQLGDETDRDRDDRGTDRDGASEDERVVEVTLGPDFDQFAEAIYPGVGLDPEFLADEIERNPANLLLNVALLELLVDYPAALPQLDLALVARLRDNLADHEIDTSATLRMEVYLIDDPAEVDTYLRPRS